MNVTALRFPMLELLKTHVKEIKCFEDCHNFLESCSSKSVLSKHWVLNFLRPVMLRLIFVRTEQEAAFNPHLYTCRKMISYFFAAGHTNYAHDGLYHEPCTGFQEIFSILLWKEARYASSKWFLEWYMEWLDDKETTYMWYGKGTKEINRVTTELRSVQILSERLLACSKCLKDLEQIIEKYTKTKTIHKEESKATICADIKNHQKLRKKLHYNFALIY